MARVTLRVVIGVVCALLVMIVAGSTLGITSVVTMDTVHTLGIRQARALARIASSQTADYFNIPTGHLTSMAAAYLLDDWGAPSRDPFTGTSFLHTKYFTFAWAFHQATNFDYTGLGWVLDENSGCLSYPFYNATVNSTMFYFISQDAYQYPKTPMSLQVRIVNMSNGTGLARDVPNTADFVGVKVPGMELRFDAYYSARALVFNNRNGMWWPVQLYNRAATPIPSFILPAGAPLFNRTGQCTGLAMLSYPLDRIGDFLTSAKGSSRTEAFALDGSLFLLGSTHATPFYTLTHYATEADYGNILTVVPGCVSTAQTNHDKSQPIYVGCRTMASNFNAYPPLVKAVESPSFVSVTAEHVDVFNVGGDNFYIANVPIGNIFRFWGMSIVLVMPESEVLGDIVSGRNAAIAITVSICVVAAIGSFAIVFRFLRPLSNVSKQMLETARLREKAYEEETTFSSLAEIQDLQRAYANMNTAIKSFTRYVPRDVVKDLMSTGQLCEINMVPQRCTMLFVDIAGFTTVCERVPPDVLSGLVSQYFDRASRIVMDHDGLIDKFIGDCIMAVWGAPFATPNQEVKATLTGKLLDRETVVDPLARAWDEAGEQLRIRVGISTGEVLAGNMGSAERMNYTVIGDPVNLAARLESMNRQFGTRVMVSEMTAEGLGNVFVLRLLLPIAVVGKEQPVKVYEVMGLPQQFDTVDLDHLEDIDHTFTRIAEAESVHSFDSHFSQNARQQREPRSTITMLREAQSNTAAAQPLTCSTDVEELAKKQTLAVVAYLNRDFNGALLLLAKLRNQLPASIISGRDGTTDKSMGIVERLCQDYLQSCPEDFDGVYRALEK